VRFTTTPSSVPDDDRMEFMMLGDVSMDLRAKCEVVKCGLVRDHNALDDLFSAASSIIDAIDRLDDVDFMRFQREQNGELKEFRVSVDDAHKELVKHGSFLMRQKELIIEMERSVCENYVNEGVGDDKLRERARHFLAERAERAAARAAERAPK
jgi:hypothetical protein